MNKNEANVDKEAEKILNGILKTDKKIKRRPVRILYQGEFLKLASGKTIWNRIGDAKSALRNHCDGYWRTTGSAQYYDTYISTFNFEHYKQERDFMEKVFQKILDTVEFIEVGTGHDY